MKPQRQRDVRCQGFRQNLSGRDCGILGSANKQTEKREVLRLKLSWCCCRCLLLFLLCYYYKHCKYWQKNLLKYLTQLVHDWASASHLAKVLPLYPRHPTSSKYLDEDRCLEPKPKPQEMFGGSNTHKVWLDVWGYINTRDFPLKKPRSQGHHYDDQLSIYTTSYSGSRHHVGRHFNGMFHFGGAVDQAYKNLCFMWGG